MPLAVAILVLVLAFLLFWGFVAAIAHLLPWLIVGVITGALAGRVVQGRGLGCFWDLVVGVTGSLIGGLVVRAFAPQLISAGGLLGLIENVIVAFLGAVVVLGLARLVIPGHRLRRGNRSRPLISR